MNLPDWISKSKIETALRQFYNNEKLSILQATSKSAVPVGDNYTSDLFRTTITFSTGKKLGIKFLKRLLLILSGDKQTISLIIKCSPLERETINVLGQEIKLFEQEAEMFAITLPAIYQILGEKATLSSDCVYASEKPHPFIIFEDLAPSGFVNVERQNGFDLDHCLLIVEKLARFHAASLVLFEKNPSSMKNYTIGLFSNNPKVVSFAKSAVESLSKAIENWPDCKKYNLKLKAILEKIIPKMISASEPKLGGFHVLNHGDLWTNNMMFSYDKGNRLKDARFVDYQLVKFTSPVVDLHYFWATSPSTDVLYCHLDTILDHYYANLLANLTRLNYSLERVPSRKQFRKDWNKRAPHGLLAAAAVLPLVKASKRKDATFEDLMGTEVGEDSFRHHAYNNERYRKQMEYLLPFYNDLGVLDYA